MAKKLYESLKKKEEPKKETPRTAVTVHTVANERVTDKDGEWHSVTVSCPVVKLAYEDCYLTAFSHQRSHCKHCGKWFTIIDGERTDE